MNAAIALFLMQDGVINGAIYALLGVTLVLVFTVTRVIFVPQGEFVAWGALTLAAFEAGTTPGTAWLLLALGVVTAIADVLRGEIARTPQALLRAGLRDVVLPALLVGLAVWIAPQKPPLWIAGLLTLALIVPMGPLVYRLAFAPMADASVLALFIAAIGVHFTLTGLGLVFFGAEGFRTTPFIAGVFPIGPLPFKGQSLVVLAVTAILLVGLWLFFERTLLGKALRATAVNRLGARLVGIPTLLTGRIAFALASAIGALSGMLVGSLTTIAYDSGFLIGLKGFVAAIAAGLASYPLTVAAAIAVGILESFSAFFASAFKEVIVFALIIPLLVWRSLAARHTDEEEE
ncbi:branched-chain amino acid ABC transporter permease [uncultured Alsobacter sp.]|uniref:branched-chain amino acid ABC transporter permease n=1 Tax=uncultured Alsobacter sp. TaxID=1748258 RepID=UPI0025D7AD4E|nr:branched-chain amino acid ABC transporter permease [uncultured Alsobacter sp.]